jgi:hypothetical protein
VDTLELTQSFAIDCSGYYLMSNHYHLVFYVDRNESQRWDTDEVVKRWQSLFKGSLLADRYFSGEKLSGAERRVLDQLVDQWRSRLTDISWFMRCLNEFILPPILDRLQIDPKHWLLMTNHFENQFKGFVGAAYAPNQACQNLGYKLSPGLSACKLLLA